MTLTENNIDYGHAIVTVSMMWQYHCHLCWFVLYRCTFYSNPLFGHTDSQNLVKFFKMIFIKLG